jgi:hypothetical protein
MAQEIIGYAPDGTPQYVGTDDPIASPTPAPPPVYRYTEPTSPKPGDISYTDPLTGSVSYYDPNSSGAFAINRGSSPLPLDENAIRESVRKSMQSNIDAINSYYAELLRREDEAGLARTDKVRALNVNSGLTGSNFATSADLQQKDKNSAARNALLAEQNVKVQEVNGNIDRIAREEIKAQKQEKLGDAEAYATYLEKARTQSRADLETLAKSGVDISTIDTKRRSALFKAAGFDDDLGFLYYNALKPKAAQLDYKYIEQADGSILAIAPDPNNPTQFVEHRIQGAGPDVGLVIDMIRKYPDAGISPADDLATAGQKIQRSRIYKEQVRPPVSAGGGPVAPGENPQLYAGLSSATATAVRAKVSQFKSEPTVQNFATLQEGNDFASSIPDDTKNPAQHQAIIYSLAKALDPGSVVREGEYATAQKYAQSWAKAYGQGVEQALFGTGFLSQEAIRNIKATIKQKYESSRNSYDNLYTQYSNNISGLTGRSDGQKFLNNYSTSSGGSSNTITAPDGQEIIITD